MKFYIVNGVPGAGKDTFIDVCTNILWPRALKVSTVDFVKQIAKGAGWNGEKTPKDRKFLSDLKDLLTEWGDVPYKKILESVKLFQVHIQPYGLEKDSVIFCLCREPQEIQKFVDRLQARTIIIRNDYTENTEFSNHADAEVLNFNYDISIPNNGTLKQLKNEAVAFCEREGLI